MIDVRCPLCKNRYSCGKMGMIPFENCGMFVIDDTIKRYKTNADRVRSMTDEELAEFLCHNVSNGTVNCAFCAAAEFCRMGHNGWLDWLSQEVNDGKEEKEENQPAK